MLLYTAQVRGMSNKTKIIFFTSYFIGLTIAAIIGEKRIKLERVEEYTLDEFKDSMHNIVMEKNDPELTEFYTKFEDRTKDEFWKENYQYLIENHTLDNLSDLSFDFVDSPEEDEFIRNSNQNIKGYYDNRNNVIVVVKDEHWYANACHEFMHFLGGIDITNYNEATTELLSRGYCNLESNNDAIYTKYFNITVPLTRIIGVDKIQESYFTRDTNLFLEEIAKYTKKTKTLIKDYNYLCDNYDENFYNLISKDKDQVKIDEYSSVLKEYWSILDEIYLNKYNKDPIKDNSLNYYKYFTAMPNVKYYGITNSYVYSCKYNPFNDDEFTIWANGTRYDVDDDGVTYLMEYDVDLNVVKKKEIK